MSQLPVDPFLSAQLDAAQSEDECFMARALLLAEGGAGWVNPNPLVGCVIVRNGEVLGEGFHTAYGKAHAEVEALQDAAANGHDVTGATMYVTLEPCSHEGKTPACAPQVVKSGVARVVVAMQDPFKRVSGAGIAMLQNRGVATEVGVLQAAAEYQNRIFIHWTRTVFPYVAAKVAVSADDYLTRAVGTTTQISSEESQQYTHALRHRYDAVLVGASTVAIDNPALTVRYGDNPRQPMPIIIDGDLSTDPGAQVFDRGVGYICAAETVGQSRVQQYPDGVTVLQFPVEEERMNLNDIFLSIANQGFKSVFVEGGQNVLTQVAQQCLSAEWSVVRSQESFGDGQKFVDDPSKFYDRHEMVDSVQSGTDTIERYLAKRGVFD